MKYPPLTEIFMSTGIITIIIIKEPLWRSKNKADQANKESNKNQKFTKPYRRKNDQKTQLKAIQFQSQKKRECKQTGKNNKAPKVSINHKNFNFKIRSISFTYETLRSLKIDRKLISIFFQELNSIHLILSIYPFPKTVKK